MILTRLIRSGRPLQVYLKCIVTDQDKTETGPENGHIYVFWFIRWDLVILCHLWVF